MPHPKPAQGRLIRLVDATMVAKAGCAAKRKSAVWRIHSAFELPSERFGYFELTDEKGRTCPGPDPGTNGWTGLR